MRYIPCGLWLVKAFLSGALLSWQCTDMFSQPLRLRNLRCAFLQTMHTFHKSLLTLMVDGADQVSRTFGLYSQVMLLWWNYMHVFWLEMWFSLFFQTFWCYIIACSSTKKSFRTIHHHWLNLMLFKTCVTFLVSWNTKGDIYIMGESPSCSSPYNKSGVPCA